jgi:hypothetical protein
MFIDISHLAFMMFLMLSGILFIILKIGWVAQPRQGDIGTPAIN